MTEVIVQDNIEQQSTYKTLIVKAKWEKGCIAAFSVYFISILLSCTIIGFPFVVAAFILDGSGTYSIIFISVVILSILAVWSLLLKTVAKSYSNETATSTNSKASTNLDQEEVMRYERIISSKDHESVSYDEENEQDVNPSAITVPTYFLLSS